MPRRRRVRLSPLENTVMQVVWARESATAEQIRIQLARSRRMKDSTVRTVLRRLEEKGYLKHTMEGPRYVYSPTVDSRRVATDAVRGIIDRFCDGSVEDLLIGMIDGELITPGKLRQLAARVAKAEAGEAKERRSKGD